MPPSIKSTSRSITAEGLDGEQMQEMLQERDARWKQALETGNTVPAFIQKIHRYATGLHVSTANILLKWLYPLEATLK